jgi:hypothetical protein
MHAQQQEHQVAAAELSLSEAQVDKQYESSATAQVVQLSMCSA